MNQIALKAAVDDRARDLARPEEPSPKVEAPCPRAVASMPFACREAARRIGALHAIATGGGVRAVDLLAAGGGGVPSSPQERAVWAIGALRAAVSAIGSERVTLAAHVRPRVVELVAWVCRHDGSLKGFMAARGVRANGDRHRKLAAALEAALDRAGAAWGLTNVV